MSLHYHLSKVNMVVDALRRLPMGRLCHMGKGEARFGEGHSPSS